jgi:hypothetical protein
MAEKYFRKVESRMGFALPELYLRMERDRVLHHSNGTCNRNQELAHSSNTRRTIYAAAGALTFFLCYFLPLSEYTLPPATLLIFGFVAGGVQGFVLRRQVPPVRRWIQASALAGFVTVLRSILPTGLAASSVGLHADWAYAWAAYGAVLGVMVQRFLPGQRWMLASQGKDKREVLGLVWRRRRGSRRIPAQRTGGFRR